VPLHERAIGAIAQWQQLAAAYSGGVPSPWLFHSVRNGAKALTRQAALLEIKETAVAAGLPSPERVSPHVLRHAFATHMHSGGTEAMLTRALSMSHPTALRCRVSDPENEKCRSTNSSTLARRLSK
jgi:integrase/recombinase XerD